MCVMKRVTSLQLIHKCSPQAEAVCWWPKGQKPVLFTGCATPLALLASQRVKASSRVGLYLWQHSNILSLFQHTGKSASWSQWLYSCFIILHPLSFNLLRIQNSCPKKGPISFKTKIKDVDLPSPPSHTPSWHAFESLFTNCFVYWVVTRKKSLFSRLTSSLSMFSNAGCAVMWLWT